ncbi:MAG: MiaB/RimO family radical SAM methylthiotransferase, partial [Anaerolineae bacterium]|nr:MiaB/RimO family radical SAM methylthiotransferase [Anaerolineae bacterium]
LRPSDVQGLVEWVRARLASPVRPRRELSTPSPAGPLVPAGPTPVLRAGLAQGEAASGEPGAAPYPSTAATPVSAEVTAMRGCDRHCTYCIVRLRRGPARSRSPDEVVAEGEALVRAGAREIVLLGQNIDAFGRDLPDRPTLAGLLRRAHAIPGLLRLRFLTSHPADLDDEVIEAVAALPKVCPHFELPVQAGDDLVLRRMGRGHRAADYLALVERIRARLPGASLATDVIVGFPGETAEQFERTLELLRAVRFDAVHVACYSVRPGTPAARLADDVPPQEKERRRRAVEELQESIVGEINARLLGQELEVLVEETHKGKWKGRTASNKLVFFEHAADWRGRLARVHITRTGPWSLQGEVRGQVEGSG